MGILCNCLVGALPYKRSVIGLEPPALKASTETIFEKIVREFVKPYAITRGTPLEFRFSVTPETTLRWQYQPHPLSIPLWGSGMLSSIRTACLGVVCASFVRFGEIEVRIM